CVASGVTSRGPNPVPPVVTTRATPSETRSPSTRSISTRSSGTTRRTTGPRPCSPRVASATSPDPSSRTPLDTPSETVTTAETTPLLWRPRWDVPPGGTLEAMDGPLLDTFGRTADDLRISVTDRCNFRCTYCMPAEGLQWLPREEILRYEEIARLASVFVSLGVRSFKLAGGEPTVRADLPTLVGMLREVAA